MRIRWVFALHKLQTLLFLLSETFSVARTISNFPGPSSPDFQWTTQVPFSAYYKISLVTSFKNLVWGLSYLHKVPLSLIMIIFMKVRLL
jgi:hypothetical protein